MLDLFRPVFVLVMVVCRLEGIRGNRTVSIPALVIRSRQRGMACYSCACPHVQRGRLHPNDEFYRAFPFSRHWTSWQSGLLAFVQTNRWRSQSGFKHVCRGASARAT